MFKLIICTIFLMLHQGQCSMQAIAVLYGDNSPTSFGTVTFTQEDANSPVRIAVSLSGLNISSAHGFHVHVSPVSDGSPNCTAAGGHFNPYNVTHGPKTGSLATRHVGDLGNLTTDSSGKVTTDMEDGIIQLYNATQSIMNRTVVVHRMRDDAGQSGASDSTTTGNAGARVLCGLIKSAAMDIEPTIFVLFNVLTVLFVELF
ncbi:hypothetical protein I4U23_025201 [Adineta vaga]|nr:hypothetical protein I4U23_025201 [Adineta vaga]